MENNFNLQEYLANGAEILVKDAIRASLKNPKESLFLAKFAKHTKKATKIRQKYEEKGQNIPIFLIASITSSCNLHCAGCYSRANHACNDDAPLNQLSGDEWEGIFNQAKDLGISFIVLAGGEPMLREDVIVKASQFDEILFPIFTNGTMITEDYLRLFDKNRNLVPIFSIEGDEDKTDARRGEGVYSQLLNSMDLMRRKNIIFGASLTFTKGNLSNLLSRDYINQLRDLGCKVIFFIEYVPVNEDTVDLAPGDDERDLLLNEIEVLRKEYDDVLFLSFPGDEKTSGGCLAAGRGFFHINSHGGAEPCPASPYSDINVRDSSLLDALDSKLFKSLRDGGILLDDHEGGCVLFEHKEEVERLLEE
ncbi:radical SAM/SPASM domain-containing protein [uncultured Methanobrevibacter sp.]|uniref:radical SAM/SPASM domain-containing protein n=1 Tax=uncultured Methanobrevibacter sp. TaxID=253161 RepID=UPI0025D8981A|nr:radical SAM protein [uncultured Methanobrevibacter sp.]